MPEIKDDNILVGLAYALPDWVGAIELTNQEQYSDFADFAARMGFTQGVQSRIFKLPKNRRDEIIARGKEAQNFKFDKSEISDLINMPKN